MDIEIDCAALMATPEYQLVRDKMIMAGHTSMPLDDPFDIHDALRWLIQNDEAALEPFVTALRDILGPVDRLAVQAAESIAVARQFALEPGIKGCPVCWSRPVVFQRINRGRVVISCEGHVTAVSATSWESALVDWNCDGDKILAGFDEQKISKRPVYEF